MKNKLRFIANLLVTAFLIAGLAGGVANAKQKIEIRISACNSLDHPQTLGLQVMKEYVEQHTKGRVQVHIFPNSQLGAELESVEQVKMGTLEMATASIAPIVTFQEKLAVLDIPFLFSDYLQAWAVLDSKIGTDLLDSLEEAGLLGLAYMENGYRHTTNNVKPVTTPADFNGLKIRTMQNPYHVENFTKLGANPTPVPFSEVYMALTQRIVDGQENPIANIWDMKLVEVQKYLSLTGHIYDAMPLVANLKWFKSLSVDDQAVIRTGAILGMNYSRFINASRENMIIEKLRSLGMQVNELTPKAKEELKTAAQPPVAAMIKKTLGAEHVDTFLKAIDKIKIDTAKSVD